MKSLLVFFLLININIFSQRLYNVTNFSFNKDFAILSGDFENVTISIVYLSEVNSEKYQGVTIQNTSKNYTIYINKHLDYYSAINVLKHEFIHIRQYYTNRLKMHGKYAIFDNVTYYFSKVKYEKRLWEIEAFNYEK